MPMTLEFMMPDAGEEQSTTLRDWFAGQAIASAFEHSVSHPDDPLRRDFLPEEWAARIAYSLADAMLAERAK